MPTFQEYYIQLQGIQSRKRATLSTLEKTRNTLLQLRLACEEYGPDEDYEEEYELEKEYETLLLTRLELHSSEYRALHLNMIWNLEADNIPLHTIQLQYGPKHPTSYLLYKDGTNLLFPRDNQNRYTSYRFWIEYQHLEDPLSMLGNDYYSAKELGVEPALLNTLYELENRYMKGETGVESEIIRIRTDLQSKI
jgi:hypothetical protein